MKKENVWNLFRNFVNSVKLGEFFDILEFEKYLKDKGFVKYERGCRLKYELASKKYSRATLSGFCSMSKKVGYLTKTDIPGVYKILNHFPPEYKITRLKKDYTDGKSCND